MKTHDPHPKSGGRDPNPKDWCPWRWPPFSFCVILSFIDKEVVFHRFSNSVFIETRSHSLLISIVRPSVSLFLGTRIGIAYYYMPIIAYYMPIICLPTTTRSSTTHRCRPTPKEPRKGVRAGIRVA